MMYAATKIQTIWSNVCKEEMPELDETCMTLSRQKKFAESIAEECFKIVDDYAVEIAGKPEDTVGLNLLISMNITNAAYEIKEKFGVK